MDSQTALNEAAAGLMKQGRRSMNAAGDCLYRGPNGLRCGIGLILPDELYDDGLEGKPVVVIISRPEISEYFRGVSTDVLIAIQNTHDLAGQVHVDGGDEWRRVIARQLRDVAEDYRLSVPPALRPYLEDVT